MMHPDSFSPHIQDSQLPPLTVLPAPPSPVTIPQRTADPLPIANFPASNPTIVPPSFPLCCCGFCQLRVVPQRRYQSTQISMEGDSRIGEVVAFSKGGCGIPLKDAVENRLSGLVGGDDLMFDGFNVSAFSLRIEVCLVISIPSPPMSANRSIHSGRAIRSGPARYALTTSVSLSRTSHPVRSSAPETGVGAKARSRELDSPSKSQSASQNSSL